MITSDEIDGILQQSFNYIVSLMDFQLIIFQFQVNHFLYDRFKEEFTSTFITTVTPSDCGDLCKPDPGLENRLHVLQDQIRSLSDSLQEVERLSMRM